MNGVETSFLAHCDKSSHSLKLWHKRFRHVNANSMKMLQNMMNMMDVEGM